MPDNLSQRVRLKLIERANRILHRVLRSNADVGKIAIRSDERTIKTRTNWIFRSGGSSRLINRGHALLEARPEFTVELHRILLRQQHNLSHWIRPERLQTRGNLFITRCANDAAKERLDARLTFLHSLESAEEEHHHQCQDCHLQHSVTEAQRLAKRLVGGIHRLPHGSLGPGAGRDGVLRACSTAWRFVGGRRGVELRVQVRHQRGSLLSVQALGVSLITWSLRHCPAAGCPAHLPARQD